MRLPRSWYISRDLFNLIIRRSREQKNRLCRLYSTVQRSWVNENRQSDLLKHMKYSTWDKNRVCAFLMSWKWTFGVSSSLWGSSVLQASSLDVSAFCSLSGWAHTGSVMLRSGSGQAHFWPIEMKLQPIRSFPVFMMALFRVHKSSFLTKISNATDWHSAQTTTEPDSDSVYSVSVHRPGCCV